MEEKDLQPKFESLPPAVTDIERDKPVEPEQPIDVVAWIPISAGRVKLEGQVTAWNRRAVRFEWNDNGTNRTVWVFRGSVEPR